MIAADTKPDFPDWLSPMLVKELRQGIRSKAFMAVFFLTQLLMILSVVLNSRRHLVLALGRDARVSQQRCSGS